MKSLPTGTVTFLFTDIEGSTALLQRLGDRRYAEVLGEHRGLLREAFSKGHGQEVDTQGDAFLVAFPRARDALVAAVEGQRALTKHAWPDGASLRVRMGLHTGEPVSGAGDYAGLDLHRASRICSAGHGGQILISQAVGVLVAPDLPPGVSLRDLGTHRLKDLKGPEHLFQVMHPDLSADFPLLKSLSARPNNNLPIQLTGFIGRAREIAEVKRLLAVSRLVTLTGTGGAGKTRLALQVAADVLDSYPDGVWLAEFAPVADPGLVPKMVASAMNVPEQPGRDITGTLVDALQRKTCLLVLDNCEHLLAACTDLAAVLLRSCPHTRVLATSREGLGVPGETLWRVPSLSVPENVRRLPPPEELILYDAVRLFADRAMAVAPEFMVTGENARAIAQVCQRLDGIPLAIELAAARVKVLAVDQIAARLNDRFRLLTGGSRAVLPRQQTLQAAMDWSHDLLSDKEKVLFRQLSVFRGGCTLEAIESVCSASTIDPAHILDLLTELVDKSLVLAETHHGEARYRLLEIVRQYGYERLLESEEVESTRRRHRDWYLEWTDRNSSRLKRDPLLEAIRAEHDNLRAALEFSIEGNHTEPGLRLVGRLSYFWYVNGDWSEGRKWLDRALALWGDERTAYMTQPLLAATFLARSQGEYEKARAFAERGLAIARETASNRYVAFFLFNLGVVALQHDRDVNRAKALFDESTTLSKQLGVTDLLAWNFAQFGHIARDSGESERAALLYEESLTFARQYGETYIIAYALRNIAVLALHARDYARAAGRFAESIDLHRAPNWVTEECLTGMAQIATIQQQYERAARLFGAADTLREALGVRRSLITQAHCDAAVAAARATLGSPAFATAWAKGGAMTLEQAIEYALAERAD